MALTSWQKPLKLPLLSPVGADPHELRMKIGLFILYS